MSLIDKAVGQFHQKDLRLVDVAVRSILRCEYERNTIRRFVLVGAVKGQLDFEDLLKLAQLVLCHAIWPGKFMIRENG